MAYVSSPINPVNARVFAGPANPFEPQMPSPLACPEHRMQSSHCPRARWRGDRSMNLNESPIHVSDTPYQVRNPKISNMLARRCPRLIFSQENHPPPVTRTKGQMGKIRSLKRKPLQDLLNSRLGPEQLGDKRRSKVWQASKPQTTHEATIRCPRLTRLNHHQETALSANPIHDSFNKEPRVDGGTFSLLALLRRCPRPDNSPQSPRKRFPYLAHCS